jgi:hypothetical protein
MPTKMTITNNRKGPPHDVNLESPLRRPGGLSGGCLGGEKSTLYLRLPAQEGISCIVDDIPDVGGITQARIGDCGYVPCGT